MTDEITLDDKTERRLLRVLLKRELQRAMEARAQGRQRKLLAIEELISETLDADGERALFNVLWDRDMERTFPRETWEQFSADFKEINFSDDPFESSPEPPWSGVPFKDGATRPPPRSRKPRPRVAR